MSSQGCHEGKQSERLDTNAASQVVAESEAPGSAETSSHREPPCHVKPLGSPESENATSSNQAMQKSDETGDDENDSSRPEKSPRQEVLKSPKMQYYQKVLSANRKSPVKSKQKGSTPSPKLRQTEKAKSLNSPTETQNLESLSPVLSSPTKVRSLTEISPHSQLTTKTEDQSAKTKSPMNSMSEANSAPPESVQKSPLSDSGQKSASISMKPSGGIERKSPAISSNSAGPSPVKSPRSVASQRSVIQPRNSPIATSDQIVPQLPAREPRPNLSINQLLEYSKAVIGANVDLDVRGPHGDVTDEVNRTPGHSTTNTGTRGEGLWRMIDRLELALQCLLRNEEMQMRLIREFEKCLVSDSDDEDGDPANEKMPRPRRI